MANWDWICILGKRWLAKTTSIIPYVIFFSLLLSSLFLARTIDFHVPSTVYCEGAGEASSNNLYWKIEKVDDNTWHVLFRNVDVKYEIRLDYSTIPGQQSTNDTAGNFELREIGPKYAGVMHAFPPLNMFETMDHWEKTNQAYEEIEPGVIRLYGAADNKHVFVCRRHSHIGDVVMEHFNSIQRGEFHPDLENKINPNSHGKSTKVLDNVKNTFGINDTNVWPKDKIIKTPNLSNKSSMDSINSSQNSKIDLNNKTIMQRYETYKVNKIKEIGNEVRDREIRSPLDQFLIRDFLIMIIPVIANLDFSITSIALYLTISTSIVIIIHILPILLKNLEINSWYTIIESLYESVYNLVKSQINILKGVNFLPFFLCLFTFILSNNLIGMIPYTLAPTSHFILAFFLSFSIVLGCTILGFIIHNLRFFSLLVPNGCPLGLLPLLVLIETVSYIARNVSLGLRLAANILSGHMLLNILSEFTYKIMDSGTIYFFLGVIPILFISGFSGLELGIAFIQSQVFVVLSSSYTNDSLVLH